MHKTITSKKEVLVNFIKSDSPGATATKVVLALVAVLGILTVVAIAPGLSMAMQPFVKKKRYSDYQLRNSLVALERKGAVEKRRNAKNEWEIRLTDKGRKEIERIICVDDIKIKIPKKWDGKWRFVIFDIPIRFSKRRNDFRFRLEDLGFYRYQNSIWVIPYPCKKEILDLAEFFGLKSYIDVLEVSDFCGQKELKNIFF